MDGRAKPIRGRVLVVDDDPDTQCIVPAALTFAGYEALVASDGLSALATIRRELPDVVILDFAIPELSGPDVFAALKANQDTCDIPVIAYSADVGAGDVPTLLAQGFEDVLLKPIDPSVLMCAVERACARRSPGGAH